VIAAPPVVLARRAQSAANGHITDAVRTAIPSTRKARCAVAAGAELAEGHSRSLHDVMARRTAELDDAGAGTVAAIRPCEPG
jgi:hypothetical protein